MIKSLFSLILFFSFSLQASEGLEWKVENHLITYHAATQTYEWKVDNKTRRTYPRHLVKRLINDLKFEAVVHAPKVFKSLETHAQLEFIQAPTSEEYLVKAFEMQNDAMMILAHQTVPCSTSAHSMTNELDITFSGNDSLPLEADLLGAHLEQQGFFSLGKLTGAKIELMTSNDNLLHGMSEGAGLTEYNKGVDGDDRGKTFGLEGEFKLEFETGEISLRSTHQGYGRLSPKASSYTIDGKEYTTYHRKNADGAHYQEFLNIEGLEVEVKKILPGNDVYVSINAKQEIFDQEGVAQKLQKSWHEMNKDSGVIQYDNLDHMDKFKRYEVGADIGKRFSLHRKDRHEVTSDLQTGAGFSSDSDFHNLRVGADLRYQYHREEEGSQRYPVFEARVFAGAKRYADGENDTRVGLELTQRFQVSKSGFFYIKGGVVKDDERYAREFGQEELKNRGKLDLQHKIGMGFEYRF